MNGRHKVYCLVCEGDSVADLFVSQAAFNDISELRGSGYWAQKALCWLVGAQAWQEFMKKA